MKMTTMTWHLKLNSLLSQKVALHRERKVIGIQIFSFNSSLTFYQITAQKPVVSAAELDAMVSSSLKDIPSDAEVSDVDDAEVEVID